MKPNDCLVNVSGLTKFYGSLAALSGIDLELQRGECLVVFGPNGAGKTTLIKILSTLTQPSSGKVLLFGSDVTEDKSELRRRIGVISHQSFLYDNLTAHENLSFYARMYDLKDFAGRVNQVLGEVGLLGREQALVGTYSRGMKQRLSIARAILHQPEVLLLDEPYTGLDQHAAQNLRQILMAHRANRSIIMTTHNLPRGLEMADRVAIQVAGKIVYTERIAKVEAAGFEELYFKYVGREHKWD